MKIKDLLEDATNKVQINSPGNKHHGRIGKVFYDHGDGSLNVQLTNSHKKGDVTNLTLKKGEYKRLSTIDYKEAVMLDEELKSKSGNFSNKTHYSPARKPYGNDTCKSCNGTGFKSGLGCSACGKTGKITEKKISESDEIFLGQKVNIKGNKGKHPLKVVKIVDDQQVLVKDDYGQQKKVMISDLVVFKESVMADIHQSCQDHLDKHIKSFKAQKLGHDQFGEHCIKAAHKIAKTHGIKHEHAQKFVNDYVDSKLG